MFTAFVEIVFDNTDGRLPADGAEVTIRRTVGAKKDEFYLDGKHATKQDIVNMLESAGFSRSNPYYIVQQGKINQLTNMSEDERLELLKEVAGTRVYEERRNESQRILDDAAAKKQQVEEMLQTLAARLNELEAERAELLEFQRLDLSRRSLQYAIYEKDRERAQSKLATVDAAREEAAAELEQAEQSNSGTSAEDEQRRAAVKAATARVAAAESARDAAQSERNDLFQAVAELRLEVADCTARLSVDANEQDTRSAQLADCERQLRECETRLAVIETKCAQLRATESSTADALRTQQVSWPFVCVLAETWCAHAVCLFCAGPFGRAHGARGACGAVQEQERARRVAALASQDTGRHAGHAARAVGGRRERRGAVCGRGRCGGAPGERRARAV